MELLWQEYVEKGQRDRSEKSTNASQKAAIVNSHRESISASTWRKRITLSLTVSKQRVSSVSFNLSQLAITPCTSRLTVATLFANCASWDSRQKQNFKLTSISYTSLGRTDRSCVKKKAVARSSSELSIWRDTSCTSIQMNASLSAIFAI